MSKAAALIGLMCGRVPVALVLAIAVVPAGCLGRDDSGRVAPAACLAEADAPKAANTAVVALLAEVDPRTGAARGPGDRLVRVSLPGGAVEVERALPQQAGRRGAAAARTLRLDAAPGRLLATARDGPTIAVLHRDPASARDRIVVIDGQTLRVRCSRPLEGGVRYGGLLLGRSRVYAYGARRAGRGLWDAVLSVGDLRTGEPLVTRTLREGQPARGSRDWFVYWGALSQDERRLILSYHGSSTTGADRFRVSAEGSVSRERLAAGPCGRRPCGPGWTDIGRAHGAIAAVGSGFVAATGGDRLLVLDRDGRATGSLPLRSTQTHLMDFAVDHGHPLIYVSGCGRKPAIQRLHLTRGERAPVPSGNLCGRPLAAHNDRYLVLDASRVDRLGYPVRPDGMRLLDLRNPGGGRRIPLPRSARALDAVVVQLRR